jgi:hypothetical protein
VIWWPVCSRCRGDDSDLRFLRLRFEQFGGILDQLLDLDALLIENKWAREVDEAGGRFGVMRAAWVR